MQIHSSLIHFQHFFCLGTNVVKASCLIEYLITPVGDWGRTLNGRRFEGGVGTCWRKQLASFFELNGWSWFRCIIFALKGGDVTPPPPQKLCKAYSLFYWNENSFHGKIIFLFANVANFAVTAWHQTVNTPWRLRLAGESKKQRNRENQRNNLG